MVVNGKNVDVLLLASNPGVTIASKCMVSVAEPNTTASSNNTAEQNYNKKKGYVKRTKLH